MKTKLTIRTWSSVVLALVLALFTLYARSVVLADDSTCDPYVENDCGNSDSSGGGTPAAPAQDCTINGTGQIILTVPSQLAYDPVNGSSFPWSVAPSNSADANCTGFSVSLTYNGQEIGSTDSFGSAGPSMLPPGIAQNTSVTVDALETDSTGNTTDDSAEIDLVPASSNNPVNSSTSGASGTAAPSSTSTSTPTPTSTGTSTTTTPAADATTQSSNGSTCDPTNASSTGICNPLPDTDIQGLIVRIVNYLMGFIAIISVIMIIVGGYQMVFSAGNEEGFKKGRQTMTYAVLGLVLAIMAYSIVAIVENLARSS